jgi:thiamine biosynthesis lipoprotein
MMGMISRSHHGFAQVAMAQVGAAVLGAIFWLILAVLIHPIAYGHLSWLISIAMILSTFCTFGLGKTVATYYPKERNGELLSSSVFVVLVLSLAVGAIVSLVLDPLVGLLVVGLSLFSISVYSELAKQQYKNYMWMWIGTRSLSLFLPLLIYYLLGTTAGILAGLVVAYFAFGGKALKHLHSNMDLREARTKLRFALHTWGADISQVAANFLDKILIGVLFGMAVLGCYQFAYRIFVLFAILPQILFFYLLPEKSAGRKTGKIEMFGVLISLGLAGLIFIFTPLVVPRIFPNFTEGTGSIQIMGLAIAPAAVATIKTSELYSQERAGTVLGAHLFALGVGITGIMSLGRSFGLPGLASSLLLLQISLAVALALLPKLLRRGEAGRITISLLGMALVTALLLGSTGVQTPQIEVHGGKVKGTESAMGTSVSITVIDENAEKAKMAIRSAFDEINRVEGLMSTDEESSEIYALNHGGTDWTNLSPEVIHVLKKSIYYSNLSDGCFDPTVKPLVDLWMKKTKERGRIPEPSELTEALERVGWKNLVIDENLGRARFLRDGMEVTLGGIAKGYAIDQACKVLEESGVEGALVDVGGDIRAIGTETWTIGIQHPRREDELLGVIELENGAIATSGDYRRYFLLGNRRIHHIINPKDGCPADACMSVTVIAENCIDADALSTSIFVAGPDKGKELLDSLGIKGLIIASDGRSITSDLWDFPLELSHG